MPPFVFQIPKMSQAVLEEVKSMESPVKTATGQLIADTERLSIAEDCLKKKKNKKNKNKAAEAGGQDSKENEVAAVNGAVRKEGEAEVTGSGEEKSAAAKKKKNKKKEQTGGAENGVGVEAKIEDGEATAESCPEASAAKKKGKPAAKKSKASKQQTDPPSVPVAELFPSGQFPEGQVMEHPVAANDQKAKVGQIEKMGEPNSVVEPEPEPEPEP